MYISHQQSNFVAITYFFKIFHIYLITCHTRMYFYVSIAFAGHGLSIRNHVLLSGSQQWSLLVSSINWMFIQNFSYIHFFFPQCNIFIIA